MNESFPLIQGFDRLGEPELRSSPASGFELVFETSYPKRESYLLNTPLDAILYRV